MSLTNHCYRIYQKAGSVEDLKPTPPIGAKGRVELSLEAVKNSVSIFNCMRLVFLTALLKGQLMQRTYVENLRRELTQRSAYVEYYSRSVHGPVAIASLCCTLQIARLYSFTPHQLSVWYVSATILNAGDYPCPQRSPRKIPASKWTKYKCRRQYQPVRTATQTWQWNRKGASLKSEPPTPCLMVKQYQLLQEKTCLGSDRRELADCVRESKTHDQNSEHKLGGEAVALCRVNQEGVSTAIPESNDQHCDSPVKTPDILLSQY